MTESKELINQDTGERREVDIVVELSQGGVDLVISYECTATRRPAGSEWVEQMIGKHLNLPTHNLILVSKSGFTDPALRAVAKRKDVKAVTLERASATDWGEYAEELTHLVFGGYSLRPKSVRVEHEPEPNRRRPIDINPKTIFRRVADSLEMNAYELALDILRNPQVGRQVMEKRMQMAKPSDPKTFCFSVVWKPDAERWEIDDGHGALAVIAVTVIAEGEVKESALSLEYISLLGKRIAHTRIEKPLPSSDNTQGDVVLVAFTPDEGGVPQATIAFPEAKAGAQKVIALTRPPSEGPEE